MLDKDCLYRKLDTDISILVMNQEGVKIKHNFSKVTDLQQLLEYDELYLFGDYIDDKNFPLGLRYAECHFNNSLDSRDKDVSILPFSKQNDYSPDGSKLDSNPSIFILNCEPYLEFTNPELFTLNPSRKFDSRNDSVPYEYDFYLTLADLRIRKRMIDAGEVYVKTEENMVFDVQNEEETVFGTDSQTLEKRIDGSSVSWQPIIMNFGTKVPFLDPNIIMYLSETFGKCDLVDDTYKISNGDAFIIKDMDSELYKSFLTVNAEKCKNKWDKDNNFEGISISKGQVYKHVFKYIDTDELKVDCSLVRDIRESEPAELIKPDLIVDEKVYFSRNS